MIDYESPIPVYRQLAAILEERIASGKLQPGRPVPSETALRQEFGVARHTARKAIAVLRKAGKVITVQGKGSYVAT